jgi:type I restriction enzyme S subunit
MASEWAAVRLSELADINPKRPLRKGENAPFVDMAAISAWTRDVPVESIQTRLAKGSGSHFKDGDTLLARITPCLENGKTGQVRSLGVGVVGEGSTEFIVLSGRDPGDNDYVYYLARSPEFRDHAIARMVGSSGRQRVAWQAIANFEFRVPPANERREAAALLSYIDDRIDIFRHTNATLEAIAHALFKSWFVDFDPVRAKTEGCEPEGMDAATAALFPSEFEESKLGLIPKGWAVDEIGKVAPCVGGATPSTKEPRFWGDPVHHWVTPKDLSGLQSHVLTDTDRKVSQAGLAKISSGLLPVGTVLLSSRAPIGYLAIAHIPTAINQGFIAMLPGGKLPPSYLLFWTKLSMDAIKQKANGSTFMEISKSAFRPMELVVAPPQVVSEFDLIGKPLLDRIAENEKIRRQLVEIRDTLLPRLISGKLRLPEAEKMIEESVA